MARRSNGEGTAYRYQGGFRAVAVINGKRRYFRAPTHREAMDKMRQARLQASAAPDWNPDADDPTCAEWLDYWVEQVKRSAVEPSTYESYRGLIDRHLIPALGSLRLSEVNFSHIDDLHRRLLGRHLSVSTIKQARSVLGQALRVARQRGKVSRNVINDTDPPRGPRTTISPLSPEHAAAILNADHSPQDAARWGLALLYGLRQGEALGLKWQDLDLDTGELAIARALKRRRGGGLVLADTKTLRSRRRIRLDPQILEALTAHRRDQVGQRLAAGILWNDQDLVFTTGIGTPVHPTDDHKRWSRLLRALGIPHQRLHDARHTAATLNYEAGSSIDDVQLLLGHSSLDFTRRTYVHTQRVDTTSSIREIRRLLSGPDAACSTSETA